MMKSIFKITFLLPALVLSSLFLPAQSHNLQVDGAKPFAKIQPTMYGVFFEDINFAADGGLYAEMVKNRGFEFTYPKMAGLNPKAIDFPCTRTGEWEPSLNQEMILLIVIFMEA